MRRLTLAVVLLWLGLVAPAARAEKHPKPTAAPQDHVGLTTRVFHPAEPRNWRQAANQDLRCTIWYPAASSAVETKQFIGPSGSPLFEAGSAAPHAEFAPSLEKLPLILLSHGTGGSALQMAWLGTALARAGYIAVAVDHPGNNANEPYTPEGFTLWWERATDLSDVLSGMLADPELGPHIDAARVGAAGFALGGYTVLELGGAQTDIGAFLDMCKAQPDTAVCHLPEMRGMGTPQQVFEKVRKTSGVSLAQSAESFRDPRVKALFAIAPALAEALMPESLRAMRLPVEIVAGAADPIAPPKDNADLLRSSIRGAHETVLPGGVAHDTFLDTCTAAGRQELPTYCGDAGGIDRDAVHAQVAAQAVNFFDHALRLR